jgi:RHS repeat-associated protein
MDADFNVLPASNYDWETRYDNYRFDDESNFFQVRNRYLHPNLGRWITRDPIENKDGMNLYAYINNNSINGVDYYGLEKITHESGPGKSACGSWKNVWKIYPQVTGTFWIVQRVSGNYSAKDCDGKNIHEYPPDWMEAWKVTVPKPGYFKDDDVFSGISNSSGNANTNVSSAIYPDKPPYSIDIPKWTYSGSYPISGAYQTNNPPTWWGKGSLGTATRSTSSTRCCCPKSKNFSTVTYSSK